MSISTLHKGDYDDDNDDDNNNNNNNKYIICKMMDHHLYACTMKLKRLLRVHTNITCGEKHGRNKPEISAALFKGKPYKLFFRYEVLSCLQNKYGTHSTALQYKKIHTRHSAKIFSCI